MGDSERPVLGRRHGLAARSMEAIGQSPGTIGATRIGQDSVELPTSPIKITTNNKVHEFQRGFIILPTRGIKKPI